MGRTDKLTLKVVIIIMVTSRGVRRRRVDVEAVNRGRNKSLEFALIYSKSRIIGASVNRLNLNNWRIS